MRALADAVGALGAVVVVLGVVWIVSRARGLRRHRIDLHVYHHDDQGEGCADNDRKAP